MKNPFILIIFLSLIMPGSYEFYSQNGHHIELNIKNYDGNKLTLAYYYGEKKYIQSQLTRQESGKFIASGKEELKPGMYLVVLPSSNKSFDFLVNKGEQHFKLSTDTKDLYGNMKFEESPENVLFYKYMSYVQKQRKIAAKLNQELKEIQNSTSDNKTQKQTEKQREIDNQITSVNAYQNAIMDMAPNSFTSKIIKAQIAIQIPNSIKNDNQKAFSYLMDHFFDNIDFSDERLMRTPLIDQKINQFYSDEITGQRSKIAIENIDRVLQLSEVNKELYRFNLAQSLNIFAKTKTPCMADAYIHIVDNYYSKGKADWVSNETLENIKSYANTLRSLTCGKKAPNLALRDLRFLEAQSNLHDVKANLTALLFWDPDNPKNSENLHKLVKYYTTKINKKFLKVYAVCAVNQSKIEKIKAIQKCQKQIKEFKMEPFFNSFDLNNNSKFRLKYNLQKTPLIYLLDADKIILRDRLSIEQFLKIK